MFGRRRDQLPAPQMSECSVDGAFGESGCVPDGAHTGADEAPLDSRSLTIEVQINQERGRPLIVPD